MLTGAAGRSADGQMDSSRTAGRFWLWNSFQLSGLDFLQGPEQRAVWRSLALFSRRHNELNVNTTMRGGGGGELQLNMTTNFRQLQ